MRTHDLDRSDAESCAGQYALLGVGDLIKANDTPDRPRPGYHTFSGPPQVMSALDATGNDVCSTAPNHTIDQLEQGANAAFALLSPVVEDGSPDRCAPCVST